MKLQNLADAEAVAHEPARLIAAEARGAVEERSPFPTTKLGIQNQGIASKTRSRRC
jgi:hypothetical protein